MGQRALGKGRGGEGEGIWLPAPPPHSLSSRPCFLGPWLFLETVAALPCPHCVCCSVSNRPLTSKPVQRPRGDQEASRPSCSLAPLAVTWPPFVIQFLNPFRAGPKGGRYFLGSPKLPEASLCLRGPKPLGLAAAICLLLHQAHWPPTSHLCRLLAARSPFPTDLAGPSRSELLCQPGTFSDRGLTPDCKPRHRTSID